MTDIGAQKQITHAAIMAAKSRVGRSPKYIALIDAAIERAVYFRTFGVWPDGFADIARAQARPMPRLARVL